MSNKLHPSVVEFKTFINKHPALIKKIRKSGRSWQEYYEQWALLGEDDPLWDEYKEAETEWEKEEQDEGEGSFEKNKELFSNLIKMTENMDLNKVQKQIDSFNNTISVVQELLGQFKQSDTKSEPVGKNGFGWFKD
ncbi:YlbD family protein [Oceanobacillus sp. GSFE11]|uniref:YlbD family protein n=1 Tax=Oceanobacillus jordanicus TaxID=2867266 RepID=A0AAW5BAL0_9BACI|nr:YlbD family protein [Oceanobacillus jordanicus]MCG3420468.1 YlbD family protein [Oceanobacillus jordanicus]